MLRRAASEGTSYRGILLDKNSLYYTRNVESHFIKALPKVQQTREFNVFAKVTAWTMRATYLEGLTNQLKPVAGSQKAAFT